MSGAAVAGARRAVGALDRFWYAPAPAARLAAVRLAVGTFAVCYLSVRFPSFTSVGRLSRQFAPVGPLAWMEAPLPSALLVPLTLLTLVLGLAFTAGVRYRLCAPLFALALLALTTYRSSFGMKFHTENLLVWHVLLLAVSPAADAASVDAAHGGAAPRPEHGRYGWALRAMAAVTAVTYVLAGLAKLRLGGDGWFGGEILQAQIAYDNLRKIELGSLHSPLGVLLVPELALLALLAWLTLAVELGAPLALLGRRAAALWSLGCFGFHLSVLATMAIAFAYPLSGVPYLVYFRAERLLGARPFCWMVRGFERIAGSLGSRAPARD